MFLIIFFKTRWLPNQVTYDVIINFFYGDLLCRWRSRNFRFFPCSVLLDKFSPAYRFTDGVTKNHRVPYGELIKMYEANLFFHCTVSEIQMSKMYRFFQDGCQTMWPINKKLTNLKKDLLGNICVKFRLNLFSRSGEEDFFKKNSLNSKSMVKLCYKTLCFI